MVKIVQWCIQLNKGFCQQIDSHGEWGEEIVATTDRRIIHVLIKNKRGTLYEKEI